MKKPNNSIKRNIGYQTIYQVLITCLPLITAPYLARTLGASQQGVFSFSNSIMKYFALVAMLGLNNLGTRSIAEIREDRGIQTQRFNSIYSLQLLSSAITTTIYIIYVIFVCRDNKNIAAIQTLSIIACVFDVNWLFFGREEFKITVTRNIVIRLSVVILILLFVKKPDDLYIYALIMCGSTLLSNFALWMIKKKHIDRFKFDFKGAVNNLKPAMVLFIPLLAMTVYHVMDSTMLGLLSDYENCGYYYNADKVINIPLGIITGFSTVLFPRIVSIINNESDEKFKKVFSKSVEGMILISTVMSFGIASIAKEFSPFFFGDGFDPCVALIIWLAPVMIFKAVSSAIRYQFLVPKKKEKYLTWSVVAGAVVNVIANYLLIPPFGALGAVYGTIIAEGTACIFQICCIKKDVPILKTIIQTLPYFIISGVMYAVVRFVANTIHTAAFYKIVIEITSGGFVFLVLCLLYNLISKKETIIGDILHSFSIR